MRQTGVLRKFWCKECVGNFLSKGNLKVGSFRFVPVAPCLCNDVGSSLGGANVGDSLATHPCFESCGIRSLSSSDVKPGTLAKSLPLKYPNHKHGMKKFPLREGRPAHLRQRFPRVQEGPPPLSATGTPTLRQSDMPVPPTEEIRMSSRASEAVTMWRPAFRKLLGNDLKEAEKQHGKHVAAGKDGEIG